MILRSALYAGKNFFCRFLPLLFDDNSSRSTKPSDIYSYILWKALCREKTLYGFVS
jgi:hypothetical protein